LKSVELVDLPDFGPEDYAQIVDGEEDPYGTDHLQIVWREKTEHVGLMEDGRLVAHAGWVPVRVRSTAGQVVDVLGLGGVMVHRQWRGSGVGRHVVLGAMDRMREGDGALGMLFCRTERLPFYQRMGWRLVPNQVTADQSGGSIVMPLRTCWAPLVAGASVPSTDMHVDGQPF
jgi:predicted N-acetyltransferase YhbS